MDAAAEKRQPEATGNRRQAVSGMDAAAPSP
jgi:hypothetical protein